jgi:predicted nucleotidyltransferase
LRELAEEYTEGLGETLKDALVSVVLFGSVARGEAMPYSDIDLYVVAKDLPRGRIARLERVRSAERRIDARLANLGATGFYGDICPILKTPEEASRVRPLYLDMTEDAILLYDRDDFFAGVLSRLKKRLKELGSVRRRMGKIRYWELKPDYRPGEVFEL